MSVINLPENHQIKTRMRVAMRRMQDSLDIQSEVVQEFQHKIKQLDVAVRGVEDSLHEFNAELSDVKTNCDRTSSYLPDALKLATN